MKRRPDVMRFFYWRNDAGKRYVLFNHRPSMYSSKRDTPKNGLSGTVTLLYAAKDERHNHAVVLCDVLRKLAARRSKEG